MSAPEETLAFQLRAVEIPFEREYAFGKSMGRRWRADFLVHGTDHISHLLVEVDGGAFIAGRHSRGTGVEKDAEKQSAAAILGFRVVRCTPRHVESGECLTWIERALGREKAA